MKRSLALLAFAPFFLVACGVVDTTGLSSASSRGPRGNANATILVSEYADLECPACARANEILAKPLLAKYANKIRYEYHHFPLRSLHRYTMDLAQASECAADQGKFWEYVDFAFEHQKDLASGLPTTWGKSIVDDDALFDRCVASGIKRATILSDYDDGIKKGVQGTPTFFVNGTQVPATMDDLSKAIDAAIAAGPRL
jgi:protein-disulfide isomerase